MLIGPELDSGRRRVAVIGAGIAGLACARVLHAVGVHATVFERQPQVGGRIATRRVDRFSFDHGAQYVRVRDENFGAYLNFAEEIGSVALWKPSQGSNRPELLAHEEWFVGTPGMSSLVLPLSAGLDVRCRVSVNGLSRTRENHWLIHTHAGQTVGPFEAMAIAVPAPDAHELLQHFPPFNGALAQVVVKPCWAAMVALSRPLETWPDLVVPGRGPIAWAARDSSKPGRSFDSERWVLHATQDWSENNLDEQLQWVAQDLLVAFARLAGTLPPVNYLAAHCWRAARVMRPLGEVCLWDTGQRVGVCGDWCIDARVEAAWQSGTALGNAIARTM